MSETVGSVLYDSGAAAFVAHFLEYDCCAYLYGLQGLREIINDRGMPSALPVGVLHTT